MRFACPEGQVILSSITREEQIAALLQDQQRMVSAGHNMTHKGLNCAGTASIITQLFVQEKYCPRAPRLVRSVAYDKSDILGCTSWHTERVMFGIALRSQNSGS